jgi:hypothetical protein
MISRKLKELGFQPAIAYPLFMVAFIGLSIALFKKIPYAQYVYLLIPITLAGKLSESKRNDFLKMSFSVNDYRLLRVIENVLVVFPFAVFLFVKLYFLVAIVLMLLCAILAMFSFRTSYSIIIPTPFYKKPFEFVVGFRNTFYLFAIAYCFTFIAIIVNNFNLGLFALVLVFLCVLSFYFKPENEYFIWSYNLSSRQFLEEKISTAFVFSSLLCLPVIIVLSIFYFQNIEQLLLFVLLGFAFIVATILAKYSAYPYEISLPQGVLLAVSVYFPPLLLGVIPYFFIQSTRNLNELLE